MNDTLIKAVQGVWKTSAPEHLGPDSDCVPILRFLGMNFERVDAARSKELDIPEGSILLNQMEYILEVLLKFEPSLQLKTRTTPGNQESFSPSSTTSHDQTVAEYLESLQMLIAEDVIDAEVAAKSSPKLHYNSDQVVINLPAIVGCLNWIALRSRPDIAFVQSMLHYGSNSRLWIQQVCAFTHRLLAAPKVPPSLRIYAHLPFVSIMADWMNDMANAVEEAEAANARAQEEVPTEPATSPRPPMVEIPVNDGRWTSDEYAQLLWYIANDLNERDQAILHMLLERQQVKARAQTRHDGENARRQAQAAENEAHERSIREWEAQMQAKGLDAPALPRGPPPKRISSQRVLPQVHEVLRQNDPRGLSHSQPAVKKVPPTSGRDMPSVFYSETEPPRIGSGVQPPPPAAPRPKVVPSIALPLAETPMTPSHPPRPPLSALPKYSSMEINTGASKHALDPPTAQAPPSKQVRCKAFPKPSQPAEEIYVAASA